MSSAPGTQLLWIGSDGNKAVDLAFDEKFERAHRRIGARDPMDIAERIEADMGRHQDQERVLIDPGSFHADALAFQVGEAADFVLCEQLPTTDMYASQHRSRPAVIDCLDHLGREIEREIRLAACDLNRQVDARPGIDIADIGKPLRAQ
jgi:hypothetical protein